MNTSTCLICGGRYTTSGHTCDFLSDDTTLRAEVLKLKNELARLNGMTRSESDVWSENERLRAQLAAARRLGDLLASDSAHSGPCSNFCTTATGCTRFTWRAFTAKLDKKGECP